MIAAPGTRVNKIVNLTDDLALSLEALRVRIVAPIPGKAAVGSLANHIEAYALDNGSPPSRLEDLVTKPGNATNWQGPYAKVSDLKDPFGHAFQYKAPGEHNDFDIVFLGKDGQSGGDGVNADYGNWQ